MLYFNKYFILVHEGDRSKKDWICQICGYKTHKEIWLKRHNLKYHQIEKHSKCQYCSRTFPYKCELEHHIDKTHPGVQSYDFSCEECGKAFMFKYSVVQCKRKHKDSGRYSSGNLVMYIFTNYSISLVRFLG